RDRISQLKQAGIAPETAIQTAQTDLAWCKTYGHQLAVVFNQVGRLSPKVVTKLAIDIQPLITQKSVSKLGEHCLSQLNEAINESQQTGKATAVSNFKKQWFTSEDSQLYFKPTDQLKKLTALAELYGAYEQELRDRQLYDYDDMILYALEKLKHNHEFLALVQENFQYILA